MIYNCPTEKIHKRNMRVRRNATKQASDIPFIKLSSTPKVRKTYRLTKRQGKVYAQIKTYAFLMGSLMVGLGVYTKFILDSAYYNTAVAAPLVSPQLPPTPPPQIVEVQTLVPFEPKTEKQQIMAYLVNKFGDHAVEAIALIRTCENRNFDPKVVSPLNIQRSGRRSYDVGIMQINVDELNTDEIERLKDYKYNIDRGYEKYKAAGNKFTAWTCATAIGQTNYLGQR